MILSYQNDKWQSSSIVDLPIVTCDNKKVYKKLISENYSMQPVLGPKGVIFAMKSIGTTGLGVQPVINPSGITFTMKHREVPEVPEEIEDEVKKSQNRNLFVHGLRFNALIAGEVKAVWETPNPNETCLTIRHTNGRYMDVVFDYAYMEANDDRIIIRVSTGNEFDARDDTKSTETYSCHYSKMVLGTQEWDSLLSKVNEKGEYHFRKERKSYF